eukprot:178561-Prorocentrum_minimum.AAC.5
MDHGGPDDEVRHVGDLGNIEGDADGHSKGKITDRLVKLEACILFSETRVPTTRGAFCCLSSAQLPTRWPTAAGEYSVIGRSMMVHADPDDLGRGDHSEPGTNGKTSKTTGNAGARIACGEITLC